MNVDIRIQLIQHALAVVVFLQSNNGIPVQEAVFFGIPESIAAMPSFHYPVISMGICIDDIDLRGIDPARFFAILLRCL